jgi:hypothetical protein
LKCTDDIVSLDQEKLEESTAIGLRVVSGEKEKTLNRKYLINRLNLINFLEGTITVNFTHNKFESTISFQAKPLPCLDNSLECLWHETENVVQKLRTHNFLNFVITDNQKMILVKAEIRKIDEQGISFYLPEYCDVIRSRALKRFPCEGIRVQLMQHGALFHGELIDFNAVAFRVEVVTTPPQSFQWINTETPVTLVAGTDQGILYSGECEITRQSCGQQSRTFVLKPRHDHIRRFKPREYRSIRHKLVPSPNIIFEDPFTGKTVNLKVLDLSGSGFSVEEDALNSVLLPGKIIPEVSIDFANVFQITCKAQVVYRISCHNSSSLNKTVKCGLTILDMDLKEHVRLLGFLQQADDPNTYVCTKVVLEELWDFFFETGFIYPKKYTFIQEHKEIFRKTYEKLYTNNPNIARYFIFQQNGVIYAHMSMIRFCRKSWLIQHHASRKSSSFRPGLLVLNQISRYVNDIHKIYSAHLEYVCCYFREDNKFPRRVFGGVAKFIDDPKGCSINKFAYFHYKSSDFKWDLSGPWMLSKAQSDDISELKNFYQYDSGGLMLNALNLDPGSSNDDDLSEAYRKLGFKRERLIFALKKDCILKAIVIVNISDIGLNMSDLTNCIKVIVLDESDLPKDTLYLVLSLLSSKFEQKEIPVLLYPDHYAEKQFIPCERKYSFWVLNLQYLDQYFTFCEKLMNHAWHE